MDHGTNVRIQAAAKEINSNYVTTTIVQCIKNCLKVLKTNQS